jgi:polygalacturonase
MRISSRLRLRLLGAGVPLAALTALSAFAAGACTSSAPATISTSAAADTDPADAGRPACDVRSYGAKGDGVTKDTAAIQAAIDACAGFPGGGEVHLQNGTFLSGTLRLASSIVFHVHGGATLLGTQDDADYPDTSPPTDNSQLSNCRKALLYAEGVHDLHVTGAGTIDGNGGKPEWQSSPERTRPMVIFFVQSQNVWIENVTVKRSGMWSVVNMEVDDLTISNLTVDSTQGGMRDGIDLVDTHRVVVENVDITSEDDSICLKSGTARGVEDVSVKNAHIHSSGVANGLKLGTASYGGFKNVTFDTVDIAHADKAAMAVESVDGAPIENIVFRNITFSDVGTPLFVLIGDRGARPAGAARRIGSIDGVRFEHVRGTSPRHDWGSIVSGYAEPDGTLHRITNVTLDDVVATVQGGAGQVPADPPEYAGQYPDPNLWGAVPASGIFFRHTDGVVMTATTLTTDRTDARSVVTARDSTGPAFE